MGATANPLVGSSWNQPPQNSILQGTNPIQIPGMPAPGTPGPSSPNQSAGATTSLTNPGGFQNPLGSNEINRNMGLTNIQAGQMKNQLAPQFAALMGQYGGQAGNFFQQLMNLGSPYYQQQQQASFNNGVNQNQNAAAMAQQQLRSQGYGASPSGANAAMIGGMQMQGSQNLAQQYLQNLFQNEQMQGLGAQGLSSLASMFNPTQLLGGTSVGADIQNQPNFFQDFSSILGSIGQAAQGGGQAASGAAALGG